MIRNLMLPTIVNRELDRMMNGLENHSVPSFVASDLIEHESGWEIQMDLPGSGSRECGNLRRAGFLGHQRRTQGTDTGCE